MNKEIEVKKVSWNVDSILGWLAVVMGLSGMAAQIIIGPYKIGFFCSAVILLGGGYLVTRAGPLREVRFYKVEMK